MSTPRGKRPEVIADASDSSRASALDDAEYLMLMDEFRRVLLPLLNRMAKVLRRGGFHGVRIESLESLSSLSVSFGARGSAWLRFQIHRTFAPLVAREP